MEETMRKLTVALLIGAAIGLSGLRVASAAPANGVAIGNSASAATATQKVYYRRWHRRWHRHCNRWRCW
jgi:predicted O-methyltransferase YrrM